MFIEKGISRLTGGKKVQIKIGDISMIFYANDWAYYELEDFIFTVDWRKCTSRKLRTAAAISC